MGDVQPILPEQQHSAPATAPQPPRDPAEALLDAAVGALWTRVRLWLLAVAAAAGFGGVGGIKGLLQQPPTTQPNEAPAGLTQQQEQELGALSAQVAALKEQLAELRTDVRELRADVRGLRAAGHMSTAP